MIILGNNYNIEYPTGLPMPNGEKYNYFSYNDLIVKDINNFEEYKKIIDKTDKKCEIIEFRLTDNDFSEFEKYFFANKEKFEEMGLSTKVFTYVSGTIRISKKL